MANFIVVLNRVVRGSKHSKHEIGSAKTLTQLEEADLVEVEATTEQEAAAVAQLLTRGSQSQIFCVEPSNLKEVSPI